METLPELVEVITALSTVPFTLASMKIALGQSEGTESALNVIKGICVCFGGPTMVYVIGVLIANSMH